MSPSTQTPGKFLFKKTASRVSRSTRPSVRGSERPRWISLVFDRVVEMDFIYLVFIDGVVNT